MKSVNITIIGAGSAQFSGGLIRDLCVTPNLHDSTVTLMDVDKKRLAFVLAMGQKLCAEMGVPMKFRSTADLAEALTGADFVINTAQDQGHGWYEAQRDIGERNGYYRGGMLGQIYQTAFLLETARSIERYCPNALLIQSSNPVFEGCTVIHRQTGVNFVGLCHGHYGYREVADVLGLEREHVTAKACGFNHWIWMTDFRYRGENAYPLLDRWIEEKAEEYWRKPRKYNDQQMSRAAIRQYQMLGLMPIGDTPRMLETPSMMGWFFTKTLEDRKYWYSQQGGFDSEEGWAQYLRDLDVKTAQIAHVATDSTVKITDVFEPIQSDEQIVPIIESIAYDIPRTFQVNIPNRGHLVEGYPEDIVVECQAVVSGSGIQGIHSGKLPSKVIAGAMNPRFIQCELVSEAIISGDLDAFKLLFLLDHETKSLVQVEQLLREWIGDPRNRCIRNLIKGGEAAWK